MLSPLRQLARGLRDRLEGLFFRLWCLFNRVPVDNPRRQKLCRHGLRHVRKAHWTLSVLESYRTLWRYVLLAEWFAARDSTKVVSRAREPDSQRILFIRLSHFGDTLHLIPLLRGLRTAFPQCTLDLLVGSHTEDLARRIPYLDRVHVYSPHLFHLHRGDARRCLSLKQERALGHALAQQAYDIAVATYGVGPVELFLIQAAGAAHWVGPVSKYNMSEPFGRQICVPFEAQLYEATRMTRLGQYLGCALEDERLEFWITPEEEAEAHAWRQRSGVGTAGYVILCPAAGWPGKQWPLDRFAAIADRLIDQFGVTVFIGGAAHEREAGERLGQHMAHAPVNLMGQTSWGVLAALIRDARLFIGGDSGPMHLTPVYNTPCIALFGPTKPEQWAPRGAHARVIRNVASCPDCWPWHPGRDCVHQRACMHAISIEQVWSACKELV